MTIRDALGSTFGLIACLLMAAIGLYLLLTHTGHALQAIPYLLLILCPALHFFGHSHGHGKHGHATGFEQRRT